jgi:hypothetical protein
MNLERLLVYGGIGYLAYRVINDRSTPKSQPGIEPLEPLVQNIPDNQGRYYFRYVGSSALRSDFDGTPIDCGMNGEPFTSAGVERQFASIGAAPTTYYAMLEIGTRQSVNEGYRVPNSNTGANSIQVGDRIQLSLTGGQFSALDNQVVTVLQLGSDACTTSGSPERTNSAIVVDMPIILQGAQDYQYPAQDGIGYFKRMGSSVPNVSLDPGHLL